MVVILVDDERVFCVGMFIESVGEQDPCAQIHIASPEGAELFAAESLELEPLCGGLLLRDHLRVFGRAFDGRNDLVEGDFDRFALWIEVDLCRLAEGIAGLLIPVLAFALVRWQPYGFTGRQMELFVDIEDGLDVVVAGIEIGERAARIAEGLCIDDERRARREVFGVHAEAFCRFVVFRQLHAWLGFVGFGDDKNEVAIERLGRGHGHFNALRAADARCTGEESTCEGRVFVIVGFRSSPDGVSPNSRLTKRAKPVAGISPTTAK